MKPILCLLLLYTAFVAANGSDSDEAELSIRIRPHGTPHHAHDDILESVEIDNHSDLFDISDEPVIEDPNEIQFIQSSSEKTRRTNKFGTGVVMAEGFTYRKERVLRRMPGFSAYRCVERLCPARVHVNDETLKGKVIRKHKGHNPDYTCVQVREALDKLEEIGRKTALETDRKSVNRDALQAVRNKLTDEALKKHLSANSSVLGRDFVSRREIIKAEGFKQDTEEDFLLEDINEDGLRAVIFMTESGRKMLEKSRDIAFDGTFGIVPQHMYQLVTIHAYIEASSVPIVYCITNHKTRTLYRRLFEAVDARLEQKPRSCMSDFELAAIQAAREVWPEIDVNLCHFHMAQSVFRRIQKDPTLLKRYTSSEEDRVIMKSLANLAFLPVDRVYEGFCALWDEADGMDPLFRSFFRTYIGPDNVPEEAIPEFTPGCAADDVIRSQLVNERQRGVTYPLSMWNLYQRTLNGQTRTNNAIEGWHSTIRRAFAGRPQMTVLLTRIKSEQAFAMRSLREYKINRERGLRQRPMRYKYRTQNSLFIDLVRHWPDDTDTPVEYLRKLATHVQSLGEDNVDPGEDCEDYEDQEDNNNDDLNNNGDSDFFFSSDSDNDV